MWLHCFVLFADLYLEELSIATHCMVACSHEQMKQSPGMKPLSPLSPFQTQFVCECKTRPFFSSVQAKLKKANMVKIFLCRHGQDEDNANGLLNGHRDEPLTPLGQSQAQTVAEKILAEHDEPFDVILSSPLQRAHHTALAIAAKRGQTVEIEPLLIERHFGILTGKPIADITKHTDDVLHTDRVTYFLSAEDSETFAECFERATQVVEKVRQLYDGKKVLLVCHGDIGKMILAVTKNITWKDGLLHPYFANTEVIEL